MAKLPTDAASVRVTFTGCSLSILVVAADGARRIRVGLHGSESARRETRAAAAAAAHTGKIFSSLQICRQDALTQQHP